MRFTRVSFVRQRALNHSLLADRQEQTRRIARPWATKAALAGTPVLALVLAGSVLAQPASAAQAVQLGTAAPFAILAYSAVTDVGPSSIIGNVGLSPAAGSNYGSGLTQAQVIGSIYSTNAAGPAGYVDDPALLTTAKSDLSTAYTAAAAQPPTSTFSANDNQLGGLTLTAGVYAFGHASSANITAASPLTLDGQGNPNSVFVFQASSDLVTASGSSVQLVNGAQACNVFWEVGSSAILSTSSSFVGTLMAHDSATLNTGATVQGRILALNGAVTLDHNTITAPTSCTGSSGSTTTTTAPTGTTATTTPTGGGTGTTGAGATATRTGSVTTKGSLGSGEGSTGTGSAAGVSGAAAVVPVGSPHTGFGGAAHSHDDGLIGLGVLALTASTGSFALAARRRRSHPKREAFTSRS